MNFKAMKFAGFIPAFMGVVLISSVAWAHPKLQKSVPASGSSLAQAPSEVVLQFNEDVEPALSKVEVKQAPGGKVVSEGKPAYSGEAKNTLRVALKSGLESGKYVVTWKATSVDTHRLGGEFQFTIQGK